MLVLSAGQNQTDTQDVPICFIATTSQPEQTPLSSLLAFLRASKRVTIYELLSMLHKAASLLAAVQRNSRLEKTSVGVGLRLQIDKQHLESSWYGR